MDTGRPESVDTEIPKNRRAVKPSDAEGWVKTSVSLRASTRRRLKAWAALYASRKWSMPPSKRTWAWNKL